MRARQAVWAGVATLAALAGARAEPAPPLEVALFVGGFGATFFGETAALYENAHPGAAVRVHGGPRIADALRVRLLAGDAPDVTDAALPWGRLIELGRVLDLTPWLDAPDATGRPWRERFRPGALDAWTLDGRTYGVPFGHAVIALWHDAARFRREGWAPPATWDEFFALCERIEAGSGAAFVLPGQAPTAADYLLRAAYHRLAGAEAYARWQAGDAAAYADPRFARAAGVVERIVRRHTLAGWEGLSHTQAQAEFFAGRAAFLVTGSWLPNEMRGAVPEGFELAALNFPAFADGLGDPRAVQTGSSHLFVLADTPQPERAVGFLRFLTSPERAEAFARQADNLAAVTGQPAEAFSPALRGLARMLDAAPASFGWPPGTSALAARLRPAELEARAALLAGRTDAAGFAARLAEARRALDAQPAATAGAPALAWGLPLGAVALAALAWWGWPGGAPPGRGARRRVPWSSLLALLGPAALLVGLLVAAPAAATAGLSLLRWDGLGDPAFAGADNFTALAGGETLWRALGNNLVLTVAPALLSVPLGLLLAGLIRLGAPGGRLAVAVALFPNLLGGVAAVLLWQQLYNPAGGLLNAALAGAGLDGFRNFAWLAPERLIWAVVPIYVWVTAGFNTVLFVAAMDGLDPALEEAAALDGAGPWTAFRRVTLPQLRPVLGVALTLMALAGLGAFETVWVLTSQQPTSATHVLGSLMVARLFQELDVGGAAAAGVLLGGLILGVAALARRGGGEEAPA